jgi:hypothetical protein
MPARFRPRPLSPCATRVSSAAAGAVGSATTIGFPESPPSLYSAGGG